MLIEQESVDECLKIRIFSLRELAVAMSAADAITYTVSYTECLPYFLGCIDADISTFIGKPLLIGITEVKQCTRTNHRCEFMMVYWHTSNLLISVVSFDVSKEPRIIRIETTLHVTQSLAITP